MKSFVFLGAASSRDISRSRLETAPTKSMERPENVTSLYENAGAKAFHRSL
jgi:hypothetical protein